ncbi:MAG TPA: S49 family peptidase [Polyangiaceae bacterium]|nr:S49 family peptidase [Polyangiaceae bacterium]
MFEIYKAALERKALDVEFDPQAVAAKIGRPLDNARTVTIRDGVAILPVSGPIFRYANLFTEISGATSIEVLATDFRNALEDRAVQAIILEINSPGGEVDGTSEFAQHIFDARGKKPVTAYVSHLGASAAYWIASACDETVCADTACLGSIGVVGAARISKDKNLIEFVSSQSPNKRPDPHTETGRAQLQKHVDDLADVFIGTVARNRDMSAEDVISRGGAGGILVGQLAVDAGLADRIGTLEGLISELSDPAHTRTRASAENLNHPPVLQSGADSETLNTGADNMADEKQLEAPRLEAVDDKTLTEKIKAGISSFFGETFGGSADSKPAVEAKPDRETQARLEKTESELEATKKAAADANAQILLLQKQARTQRFEGMAKGWAGEPPKHVAILEHLAQAEGGEESEMFKGYVIQQNALTEQLRVGGLFKEAGSSATITASAYDEIRAKAKAAVEASAGKLTYEQATSEVTAKDPDLYRRYLAEQRSGVVAA